jgi:hypothetical protein
MTWESDLNDKLDAMDAMCALGSALDCDPLYTTISQDAYALQIQALKNLISAYIALTTTKEADLRELIIADFTTDVIADIVYDPVIYRPTEPYPTGYDDYLDLFGGEIYDTIMGHPSNWYYEGCILVPGGTTPRIQADITSFTDFETTESAARHVLIDHLRQPIMQNTLVFLTENFTITGLPKTKSTVATTIYTAKHAKDIIDRYSLDTYIPTYLR